MRNLAQFSAEVLRRIREFLDRQPVTIAVGDLTEPRKLLDDTIAQLEAHGSASDQRRRSSIAGTGRIRLNTRIARQQYLLPLSRAADHLFIDDAELRASFRIPDETPPRVVVDLLRGMADAAAPYKVQFAKAGFADDFVQRMHTVADQLKSEIDIRARELGQRAAANAGKRESRRAARTLIRLLDAHVAPRLAGQPLYAEWKSLLRQGATTRTKEGESRAVVPETGTAA